MKDYNNVIVWLDYFNKSLTRNDGRRVPSNKSIFDPTLEELTNASVSAGFSIVDSKNCKFPRRPCTKSGYLSIKKSQNKINIVDKIATALISIRSKQNNSL